MAWPIKNSHPQILNVDLLRLCQRFEIISRRAVEIDYAAADWATGGLLHVSVRTVQDLAARGQRAARYCVGTASRTNQRPFQRVQRHSDYRPRTSAVDFARR